MPVVTAAGDMVTLPSLFLATYLVRDFDDAVVGVLAVLCAVIGVGALVVGVRSHLDAAASHRPRVAAVPRSRPGPSAPSPASRSSRGSARSPSDPALLIVIPPLLSLSGSLAGILSARVSTKLHLGVLDPSRRLVATGDRGHLTLVFAVALPIFLVLGIAADVLAVAAWTSGRPGVLEMLALMLLAGFLATDPHVRHRVRAARS